MTARYPRQETIVEFDGISYPKSSVLHTRDVVLTYRGDTPPSDPRFTHLPKWNAWQATVPLSDCASAHQIKSLATHLGHECQVMSIADDGTALLYYLGGDTGRAVQDGFTQSDPGTFAKLVTVTELRRYREEWTDLLFGLWCEKSFGDADEGRR